MEKIKKVFSKENYTIQKLIIAAILSILIGVVITVTRRAFIWDRIIIIGGAVFFVLLHFIIPLNKMYEFIYDKRYWIALVFMVYVMVFGYSGSSIGEYAEFIQEEAYENYQEPVLRSIKKHTFRWMVC